MRMLLCGACGRHARGDEHACPFCGGALAEITKSTRRLPRVSRAVLIAGVGAAAVGTACTATQTFYGGPFDASNNDSPIETVDAAYGGPPFDASEFDVAKDVAASDADAASDDADAATEE